MKAVGGFIAPTQKKDWSITQKKVKDVKDVINTGFEIFKFIKSVAK